MLELLFNKVASQKFFRRTPLVNYLWSYTEDGLLEETTIIKINKDNIVNFIPDYFRNYLNIVKSYAKQSLCKYFSIS